MPAYFIQHLEVKNLWGYRNISLPLNRDVNVLIGPNASGKTTILNLLRFIFTVDLLNLAEIPFDKVILRLKSFTGNSTRTVKVHSTENGFEFVVSKNSFKFDLSSYSSTFSYMLYSEDRPRSVKSSDRSQGATDEAANLLSRLVPAVWLPVSRRLPAPKADKTENSFQRIIGLSSRSESAELVDVSLRKSLEELSRYYSRLSGQLSGLYKKFQNQVLGEILYSKQHDQIGSLAADSPTQADKDQLLNAFKGAGLLNPQMRKRIDEHFSTAAEALKRLNKSADKDLNPTDAFIIPLIRRTKSMSQFARELEDNREALFKSLRDYEKIVNSFLNGKTVEIQENGELRIASLTQPGRELSPTLLSSGEKQILILLTQALLRADQPTVYVADEPELSLHVSWQEKLLTSLVELGKQIQIIVATHSPDIVGPFIDKVIDLGEIGN